MMYEAFSPVWFVLFVVLFLAGVEPVHPAKRIHPARSSTSSPRIFRCMNAKLGAGTKKGLWTRRMKWPF